LVRTGIVKVKLRVRVGMRVRKEETCSFALLKNEIMRYVFRGAQNEIGGRTPFLRHELCADRSVSRSKFI
jgi:hypothetical protein